MTTTVTAITTERTVAPRLDNPGWFYAPAEPEAETYVIRPMPTFSLALERSEAAWIVRDRETGIFGTGPSPSEAVADFRRAARDHREVLERQDALSEDLRNQLAYLRTRVV